MKSKIFLTAALLIIVASIANAQLFGKKKSAKIPVDLNLRFAPKKSKDPEMENRIMAVLRGTPALEGADLKVLHITSADWSPLKRTAQGESYMEVIAQDLFAQLGYTKDGHCYYQNVTMRVDALGGGRFQSPLSSYLAGLYDKIEMSCEILDSAFNADKGQANTKTISTPVATEPVQTKTTSAPATPKAGQALIDLSPIGLNATMVAASSVKAIAGSYSNSIKGDANFEISVEETTLSVDEMKAKVQADKMNVFQKIFTSDAKGFIYVAKMMSTEMAHFEYIVSIDGKTYRFYDKRNSPLTLGQLRSMYDAAKTITSK